jgi:hypothetical protein
MQIQMPAHENESHHSLHTAEKMELATKLVGLYCEKTSIHNKVEGSQLYATSTATTINLKQSTTS